MLRAGVLMAGVVLTGVGASGMAQPLPSTNIGLAASRPATAALTHADKALEASVDAAKPKPSEYPAMPEKKLFAKADVRGKTAPKLQVEQWLTLEPDTKGKTVLVDVWATWCLPCRALIPELEGFQEKFKDDLVVIGLTNESVADINKFFEARGSKVNYPIARDSQSRLTKELGLSGIPHILVISSDGIVRWQGYPLTQDDRLTEVMLKQIIEADKAARAGRKSENDRTPAVPSPDSKPSGETTGQKRPEEKK